MTMRQTVATLIRGAHVLVHNTIPAPYSTPANFKANNPRII